jgi:hypothetical protein
MQRLIILLLSGFALFAGTLLVPAQEATPETTPAPSPETLLDERGVNVFPLEAVTETAPNLQDVTATSARVNFIGTIPLGCILVYGETTDFGNATQDPRMSGATMIDHNPVMRDLQPETTYYYRLQGSDVQGNFYTSEIFTFTTPPQSDETSANLLSPQNGAEIVAVSSNFGNQPNTGSTWGADNAFDDDPNTAWSTDGDGDEAFVEVRLGQRSQINQIEFWTRTMSNDTAQIFSFRVIADDGTAYGPFELPDPQQPYTFDVDFTAESLRFEAVETNGGNTGAVSIAAYGEPVSE